jgi:hypothetical protein
MIRIFSILFGFCLMLGVDTAIAQGLHIIIPDTSAGQGNRIFLPIQIRNASTAMDLALSFEFPANRIAIRSARTSDNTLFPCPTPLANLSVSGEKGQFTLNCSEYPRAANGLLLYIETEILAGRDSAGTILVKGIRSGGMDTPFTQQGGTFVFSDPAIIPTPAEGIGECFPNPFIFTTRIPYTIAKETVVHFGLFDVKGRLVYDFETFSQKPGNHVFELRVENPDNFASGAYTVRMQTDNGVYNTNILHQK